MNKIVFSRQSDEWSTPQDLYDRLHEEFGFTLDCAANENNSKCEHWLDDALGVSWGQVNWLNPPYSLCRAFVEKAFLESFGGHKITVLLLPSRTDTRWWHDFVWDRDNPRPYPGVEVRFIKGRVKFGGAANGAPFPSVIVVMRGV